VYKNDNDIIIIKELVYDNYYFIFCMVNKYLFLFNEKNNITNSFLLNENDITPSNYYDLLPDKVSNNIIQFIISLNKNSYITLFYYLISLETSKMVKISILNLGYNVYNNLMRCLINNDKSYFYCFYVEQINNINYLQLTPEIKIDDISYFKSNIIVYNYFYTHFYETPKNFNFN